MITYRSAYLVLSASFFFLLATQGSFFPEDYYIADEATTADANLFFLIFWPSYFFCFLLLYWNRKVQRTRAPISLIILAAAVILSVIFSELPEVSARRAAGLFLSLGCALLIVKSAKDPQEIVNALYFGLIPLVLLSVAGALAIPSRAIHYASPDLIGDWKGIFSHKNTTAYVACIALVLTGHQLKTRGPRIVIIIAFCASLLLLVKANSLFIFLMAPICFITASILGQKSRASRLYMRLISIGAILTLLPIAIITIYFPRWPELLGTTLNYRTEIWSTLLSAQSGRELLGHGYGAVHNVGENSIFWRYGEWRIQTLGHGHSGQIDVYAATGLIGWCAINFFLLSTMTKLDLSAPGPARHQGVVFAFLAWIVITRSFVESNLLETGRLDWFLCSVAILSLHRWYRKNQQESNS